MAFGSTKTHSKLGRYIMSFEAESDDRQMGVGYDSWQARVG